MDHYTILDHSSPPAAGLTAAAGASAAGSSSISAKIAAANTLLPSPSETLPRFPGVPTGSYTTEDAYDDIDRDSEIGSGSTDVLLGGFKRFDLGSGTDWSGFTQALLDLPVLSQVQYRPGTEFDVAVGAYYNGLRIGRLKIAPIGQIKLSVRSQDTGANSASPVASGFERILAAPGLELDLHPFKVYTDVELPQQTPNEAEEKKHRLLINPLSFSRRYRGSGDRKLPAPPEPRKLVRPWSTPPLGFAWVDDAPAPLVAGQRAGRGPRAA